jgi:hypothetical protein
MSSFSIKGGFAKRARTMSSRDPKALIKKFFARSWVHPKACLRQYPYEFRIY